MNLDIYLQKLNENKKYISYLKNRRFLDKDVRYQTYDEFHKEMESVNGFASIYNKNSHFVEFCSKNVHSNGQFSTHSKYSVTLPTEDECKESKNTSSKNKKVRKKKQRSKRHKKKKKKQQKKRVQIKKKVANLEEVEEVLRKDPIKRVSICTFIQLLISCFVELFYFCYMVFYMAFYLLITTINLFCNILFYFYCILFFIAFILLITNRHQTVKYLEENPTRCIVEDESLALSILFLEPMEEVMEEYEEEIILEEYMEDESDELSILFSEHVEEVVEEVVEEYEEEIIQEEDIEEEEEEYTEEDARMDAYHCGERNLQTDYCIKWRMKQNRETNE